MRARSAATVLALGALVLLGSVAVAGGPLDDLRAAIDKTKQARSARIAVTHTVTTPDRRLTTAADGALSGGDSDVRVDGERGRARRIAVGTNVYERAPDDPSAPWRRSSRPAPAQTNAFGSLTLPDGTSIADPRLFQAATEAGVETLPQGDARKLVADLDMTVVASALKLSTAETARVAQMRGTLTVWITLADGRVARNTLVLTTPSGASVESSVDLTDLDAPIVIGAP